MALQPSPLLRGFEQGADGEDVWNRMMPGEERGPLTLDPQGVALGQQFQAIKAGIEARQARPIWDQNNPVGTETTLPQQSMGMPDPSFRPGVFVGGGTVPMSQEQIEGMRQGQEEFYDQATLLAGSRGLFTPGGASGGPVALASRRPLANPPPSRAPGELDRISTRIPWAKPPKGGEPPPDPHASSDLVVGIDSSRASGDAFGKNAEHIASYSDIPTPMTDPEGRTRALIAHARDNLLYLHDSIPPEIRERSKLWYDGANVIANRFGGEYGVSPSQAGGSLAALSPQKDWFQNVDLAKRLLDIRRDQGGTVATPEMMAQFDRFIAGQKKPEVADLLRQRVGEFAGTPLSEIQSPQARALWMRAFDEAHNPRGYRLVTPEGQFGGPVVNLDGSLRKVGWGSLDEIAKAVGVAEAPDLPTISRLMGSNHKVRNFYNNIVSPNAQHGDVTIDTHAIAAAHMRPLAGSDREVAIGLGLSPGAEHAGTGSKGLYGGYAEAYRQAAAQLGILPRELQSITWEGVRGLYSDVLKRNKDFTGGINDIWNEYGKGRITGADARARSVNAAGGIDPPEWWQPGAR